jgi:DNA excision repair protein ERCC-2
MKSSDAARLTQEYQNLVQGLSEQGIALPSQEVLLGNPLIPDDILQESVPGR